MFERSPMLRMLKKKDGDKLHSSVLISLMSSFACEEGTSKLKDIENTCTKSLTANNLGKLKKKIRFLTFNRQEVEKVQIDVFSLTNGSVKQCVVKDTIAFVVGSHCTNMTNISLNHLTLPNTKSPMRKFSCTNLTNLANSLEKPLFPNHKSLLEKMSCIITICVAIFFLITCTIQTPIRS